MDKFFLIFLKVLVSDLRGSDNDLSITVGCDYLSPPPNSMSISYNSMFSAYWGRQTKSPGICQNQCFGEYSPTLTPHIGGGHSE